jgi:hypothetical protein
VEATSRLRFNPDLSAVSFDHFFADRKPDARPGIFSSGVQALENTEDSLEILGFNADAVIPDVERPLPVGLLRRTDVNDGAVVSPELDRVADEVLESPGTSARRPRG